MNDPKSDSVVDPFNSAARLGDLLYFGQLFIAFGSK